MTRVENKRVDNLAVAMMKAAPKGTSPVEMVQAACIIAACIIKQNVPANLQRDVSEKFVSDFYAYATEMDHA